MGWKESEEAASHRYFVQPKGKSTSGIHVEVQVVDRWDQEGFDCVVCFKCIPVGL